MSTLDQMNTESARQTGTSFSPDSDPRPAEAGADQDLHAFVYDLRIDGQSSERFYTEVADFSARVVAEIDNRAAGALDGYTRYVTQVLREAPSSRGEYALELLTVGSVFRLFGGVAATTPGWVVDLARELFWLRRRSTAIKPVADFLRAGLFQFFMPKNLSAGKVAAVAPRSCNGAVKLWR